MDAESFYDALLGAFQPGTLNAELFVPDYHN
jgi:hypothetical protein